ncbi:hypothetical protein [Kibdelosporangium phytohabitans]|uniref:Uncharacterized protein n=1 Tax=Kibdelosporangium phytohabitans TaxID=860235 RepID=A0A0N9HTS4_9PSEU|nr:hypothetical protein [Kibdelosporangium phytohabitans]ALG06837.1 hypothetical protein AOZ06_07750 [Kibdelosporangium phytohabitans]MBE1468084.1 hypothetical protein [Kibdelosporangium phytohabitans]
MARTARTPITAANGGTTLTATTANADGEMWVYNGGRNKLVVINGSGGSINVTVLTPAAKTTPDGLDIPDRVIAVPAGQTKIIRESDSALRDDGMVWVEYSAVTTVTAYLLQD